MSLFRTISVFRALVVMAGAYCAVAWSAADPLAREYFVRQGVDESLLIRVDGVDAEFHAAVMDIDGVTVTSGGVTEQRLAPLFLYIAETSRDRQLDIRVIATRSTGQTRFSIGLNRVGVRDQRSATLDRAYRQLAFGLQPPDMGTAANWSVKAGSLSSAARTFGEFGMDELRLWSGYYQAHVTAIGMGDSATALGLLTELQGDVALSRFPEVGLALAWLRLRLAAPERDARATLQAAESLLAEPAIGRQPLVRAEARFKQAEALVALDRLGEGMDEYQAALDQADRIGADDLSTMVRERLVELHGQTGDAIASGEVLREIESRLDAEGQGDELAQNLLAQGRLLNDAWRFHEAENVLTQALSLQRNSATQAQVQLELARVAMATGQFPAALELAEASARAADGDGWRRQTSLLDVGAALGIMADVHRHEGDFTAMREARAAQGERLSEPVARDAHDYARVLDALASGGGTAAANGPIERLISRRASPWSGLAQLQRCRLGGACDAAVASAALEQSRATGQAAIAVEAAALHADWLAGNGRRTAALDARQALVDELTGLQRTLPGVIATWCWQRCDIVLETFIAALMTDATPEQAQLGLAHARALADERYTARRATANGEAPAATRETLRLAATGEPASVNPAANELARLRETATGAVAGPASLAAWRDALGASAAVLDFHIGADGAWLLLTDRQGTRRFRLGAGEALARDLVAVANRLAETDTAGFDAEMTRLGQRLLGPVAGELPGRLYWVGAGALARIPPAALRVNGAYLVENHDISSPLEFPLAPPPAPARAVESGMFLAGAPESFQPGYLATLSPAPELDAVASLFVGPGLQVVRGSALLPDEFTTAEFRQAGRVHLATPVTVDWTRPEASWMELSEPSGGGGRERITPADMTGWTTVAATLFLGQSDFTGEASTAFSLRPPLVWQWLAAGAASVPATLWPGDAGASVEFVEAFYAALESDPDPAAALAAAMRDAIAGGRQPREWARYRLYSH